jgi:hypothetical protein
MSHYKSNYKFDFKFKHEEILILVDDYNQFKRGTKAVYIMFVGDSRQCKVRIGDDYHHIPLNSLQSIREYRKSVIQDLDDE